MEHLSVTIMIYALSAVVVLILVKEIIVTYRRERMHTPSTSPARGCTTLPFETELDDERAGDRSALILDRVREQGQITNDAVQAMFKVSHTTAWRYLEALEKEGKLHQTDVTGRGTAYVAVRG